MLRTINHDRVVTPDGILEGASVVIEENRIAGLSARTETSGDEGFGYEHLPGLGGRRRPAPDSPNTGWRNASFRGYADHMETVEFAEDFERLLALVEEERTCVMCSEAVWWRCHRRMIFDALVVLNATVEHILGRTRRQRHELTPFAEVVDDERPRLVYPPPEPAHDP